MTLATTNADWPVPVSPKDDIALATDIANQLADVIEKKKVYRIIEGKKFPVAEAWQTVVALDHAHPNVDWVEPIIENEQTVGYLAKVLIVKNGETIASGIMPCGFDDYSCRGKSGTAKHRACMSTAQTWAGAKAARTKYAWIMVLAGYEPTPAEEMDPGPHMRPEEPQSTQQTKTAPQPRQRATEHRPRDAGAKLGNCAIHPAMGLTTDKDGVIGHPQGPDNPWCYNTPPNTDDEDIGDATPPEQVMPIVEKASEMGVIIEAIKARALENWGNDDLKLLTEERNQWLIDWMDAGCPVQEPEPEEPSAFRNL